MVETSCGVADGVIASRSFQKPSRVPSQIIVSGEGPQIGYMNASAQLISRTLAREFQACRRSLMLTGFVMLWMEKDRCEARKNAMSGFFPSSIR